MKETDYQYVLAIANCCNFTQAAELLHLSQPALSRYISNLEKKLGVTLFDRSVNPIRLTQAGERFCSYANTILESEKQLLLEMHQARFTTERIIHLGLPLYSEEYFLSRLIPLFLKDYPHIHLDPIHDISSNLIRRLIARQIDVAFTCAPLKHHAFNCEPLVEEKLFLVGNRKHPALANYDTSLADLDHPLAVNLASLIGVNFIHCKPVAISSYLVEENLTRAGFQASKYIKVPSMPLAFALARQQVGFTPAMCVQLKYSPSEIIQLLCPIEIGECNLPFYLAYNNNDRATIPELDTFLNKVQEEYRRTPYL